MKESEVDNLINEKVTTSIEEKVQKILAEQTDQYIKDQLKEQVEDIKKEIPAPSSDQIEADKKAKEFKSGGEFLCAVKAARSGKGVDDRLTYLNSKNEYKTAGHMEIGEDAQGGFLVPEEYRMELQQIALENSIVRERATVLPMGTDSLKIPYVNDTSHVSSVFGGVVAYWTAEAEAKTATKPTFGQMELTPHKLAGLTYSSDELLADSAIALESLIRQQFGYAWGYYEDDAFLTGTGAGQIGLDVEQLTSENLSNSVKPSFIEDGNTEPSLGNQEGVETVRQAPCYKGEDTVQTTNTIH